MQYKNTGLGALPLGFGATVSGLPVEISVQTSNHQTGTCLIKRLPPCWIVLWSYSVLNDNLVVKQQETMLQAQIIVKERCDAALSPGVAIQSIHNFALKHFMSVEKVQVSYKFQPYMSPLLSNRKAQQEYSFICQSNAFKYKFFCHDFFGIWALPGMLTPDSVLRNHARQGLRDLMGSQRSTPGQQGTNQVPCLLYYCSSLHYDFLKIKYEGTGEIAWR